MFCLLALTSLAFADECEPDAIVLEEASFIEGTCVIPWDSSKCAYTRYTDAESEDPRPIPYRDGAWFRCGPGSSAAMLRLWAADGNQGRALFW